MRTCSSLALLCLVLAASPHIQAQSCPADVLRVEKQMLKITLAGDVKALESLLADGFVAVSAAGKITEREQLLDRKAQAGPVYKRLDSESLDVRCHGSAAVVIGTATVEFAPESMARYSGRYRYLRVYVSEQGRWKAVSLQLARLDVSNLP